MAIGFGPVRGRNALTPFMRMNGDTVTINLALGPVVSLIAGVLILIVPRLLNYIVAVYLILIGLIGVFGWTGTHIRSASVENGQRVATILYIADVPAQAARSIGGTQDRRGEAR